MSAFDERRNQDLEKIQQLVDRGGGKIRVLKKLGQPLSELELEFAFKTANSQAYPTAFQERSVVNITLPSRYPFVEPIVKFKTPILHPNVYASGQICLGLKWLPTFGLDHLVQRVLQILIFDPNVLNEQSPANRDALAWYRDAKNKYPRSFPTDSISFSKATSSKKMSWNTVADSQAKTEVTCPSCERRLRVPSGKHGTVKCPACSHGFVVRT
jgi:ubiquitin-protein ligase